MAQVPHYLYFYLAMLSTILTDPQNSDPQTSRPAAENKPLQECALFFPVRCEVRVVLHVTAVR